MYRTGLCIALITVAVRCTFAASEIRDFSVPTLERLGDELYHRDQIAARSASLLRNKKPVSRLLKMRGWISDLRMDGASVYWITESPSGPALAYRVIFHGLSEPEIEDLRGQPIPPKIAVRYKARKTAIEALKGKLYNLDYTFEVLDDPDRSGFLVYALGTTGKPDEIVLGGHFRITVSADGTKAERIDPLSRSVLVSREGEGLPPGAQSVGMAISQLISNKPVETLVYANRLTGKPIAVSTPPNGQVWYIENGKITREKGGPSVKQRR